MAVLTPAQVFVPGGMPKLTYVPREERSLEKLLESARDNLCKLATLTGPTKSGKTVLANRIFPRAEAEAIWLDGGGIDDEQDFWRSIHSEIEPDEEVSRTLADGKSSHVDASVEGQAKVPIFGGVKGKGEIGRKDSETEKVQSRPVANLKSKTLALLRQHQRPLIVDDFHYIDRSQQGSIVRALKPLIFEGLPVVFIAIPHRRYDVVRVEREMTGRILSIGVPSWTIGELRQIAEIGFEKLDLKLPEAVIIKLAEEAYGSPHLMQEFCREIAKDLQNENALFADNEIKFEGTELFEVIAESTGKVIFDKLAKGPRQRSDRMQRPLVGGGNADIYRVVLLALSKIGPGLNVVDYESLRQAIRQVLTDSIPQANEVTRVLEKMAEIASKDENSVAVLDWDADDQKLHITDPFFAFFLRWSEGYIRESANPTATA